MKLDPTSQTLTLSGAVDIDRAIQLKERLLTLLSLPSPHAVVDLAQVTEMDLAGVQVLAAAALCARRMGKQWRFCNPPQEVRSKLILVGLNADVLPLS
ncbi:MAG: anti-sigma factor antagonist [Magnetococcales bacterium]|nr:anti-sigma factor antagonist [Magnetococcales bacterium]